MTPNQVLSLAKKRLGTTSNSVDWSQLYRMSVDDIFGFKRWKFGRGELNYIHTGGVFEKQFNATATEQRLMMIETIRYTTTYTAGPVAVANTAEELPHMPLQKFMTYYPDQVEMGIPFCWTDLLNNDGTNGMKIGIYFLPVNDIAVWVNGYFYPYFPDPTIGDAAIPYLPVPFHSMLVDRITYYGALDLDLDKKADKAERLFEKKLSRLIIWDDQNPKYVMKKRSIEDCPPKYRVRFPDGFPLGY